MKVYLAIAVVLIEVGLFLTMAHNYYIDDIQRATFDGVLILLNRAVVATTLKSMAD